MTPDCEERPPRSPSDNLYLLKLHCSACNKIHYVKAVLDSIRRLERVDSTGLAKEKEEYPQKQEQDTKKE